MKNDLTISQLEERLVIQQSITAFLIAHLVDQGLINLDAAREHVALVAKISGFHDKALEDIDRVFGTAELTLKTIGRLQQSIADQDK